MRFRKLIFFAVIVSSFVACDNKWPLYNGEIGDCPWCENGYDEASNQCIHCENGFLTEVVYCSSCSGIGLYVCPFCHGSGGVWKFDFNSNEDSFYECRACHGFGKKDCLICNGKGYYYIDKFGNRSPF